MKKIKVVLRNPLNYKDQIDYNIVSQDHELADDWISALKGLLQSGSLLEKNYCFMGFPKTARTLEYLCNEVNTHIDTVNKFFDDYNISLKLHPDQLLAPDPVTEGPNKGTLGPNHELFNELHNHFERLQGTVWALSDYYKRADYETKYAIRQLNNLCHEMENLILSKRKQDTVPFWVRPSQITTFINAQRHTLKDSHRQLFLQNGYDRVLGGVYMHWTQIGKTLFEVWRDEGAPELTDTVCEAITELKYYSGEFDVEWGNDVTMTSNSPWHVREQIAFKNWLVANNRNPNDASLSLGYLPLGQVDLLGSFGTYDYQTIWDNLSNHLDIYRIEVDGVSNTFEYCWSDAGYKQMQIDMMKPGYDYSSRQLNK